VRCGATGCNHRLRKVGLIHWLVALVGMELIDRDELLDNVEQAIGNEDSGAESDFGGLSPGEFTILL
jgi:hypothetical protein